MAASVHCAGALVIIVVLHPTSTITRLFVSEKQLQNRRITFPFTKKGLTQDDAEKHAML